MMNKIQIDNIINLKKTLTKLLNEKYSMSISEAKEYVNKLENKESVITEIEILSNCNPL